MLADTAVFSTAAIGSVWLTLGRNTGQTIGTTTMTYMWTTTMAAIIYTTVVIPAIVLLSASTLTRRSRSATIQYAAQRPGAEFYLRIEMRPGRGPSFVEWIHSKRGRQC